MASAIPHARIAPDFLQSNAQAHHDILYALADLLDNTREAGARRCEINVRRGRKGIMIEMIDNGSGMTEATMREMLSIAYTSKDRTTGKHYGMGSTTSIPRLCKSALCFSVHRSGHCTAGLLSTTLSKKLGADELKVPQCSWFFEHEGGEVAPAASFRVRDTDVKPAAASVLTEAARRESLALMLAHTPFSDEAELVDEFRALQNFGAAAGRVAGRPATGTRWLLWALNDELIVDGPSTAQDIVVRGRETMWQFERSLRGFCEVLYYCDDDEERRGRAMVHALVWDRPASANPNPNLNPKPDPNPNPGDINQGTGRRASQLVDVPPAASLRGGDQAAECHHSHAKGEGHVRILAAAHRGREAL